MMNRGRYSLRWIVRLHAVRTPESFYSTTDATNLLLRCMKSLRKSLEIVRSLRLWPIHYVALKYRPKPSNQTP